MPINDKLKEMQHAMRTETLNRIQQVIDELIQEQTEVTTKLLIERTGLSRSLFSKQHVKEILQRNQVCRYAPVYAGGLKQVNNLSSDYQLSLTKKRVAKLQKEIEKEKKKNEYLQIKLEESESDYQLLLGKWHLLLRNAKIKGIDIHEQF